MPVLTPKGQYEVGRCEAGHIDHGKHFQTNDGTRKFFKCSFPLGAGEYCNTKFYPGTQPEPEPVAPEDPQDAVARAKADLEKAKARAAGVPTSPTAAPAGESPTSVGGSPRSFSDLFDALADAHAEVSAIEAELSRKFAEVGK